MSNVSNVCFLLKHGLSIFFFFSLKKFLFVWISKQETGASISGIKFKLLVSISTKFHHLLFLKYNCIVAGENQFFNHHSQSNLSNYHFNFLYFFTIFVPMYATHRDILKVNEIIHTLLYTYIMYMHI